ncbi:VTT domain-containing protein [Actinomycetaceae bacterium TAE3-ERU4]|nr:VTT domain-containing protein [Actinomycetaceae bacterium TAE3-ERU4]
MTQWLNSLSLRDLILALTIIVFFRAQGTYWIGRFIAAGAVKNFTSPLMQSVKRWFEGPTPRKGAKILERWGIIVIPLCFLTVGVQTAINAGAGIVKMDWKKYTLAMIPGCIIWGILYAAGLLAIWKALFLTLTGSWQGLLFLLTLSILLFFFFRIQRSKRKEILDKTR